MNIAFFFLIVQFLFFDLKVEEKQMYEGDRRSWIITTFHYKTDKYILFVDAMYISTCLKLLKTFSFYHNPLTLMQSR